MKKVKVLHVLGGLGRGGAETYVMRLYRKIDRSKFQFDFVIYDNCPLEYLNEIERLGGCVYKSPYYNLKNLIAYVQFWKKFFLNHTDYQIIHGHLRSTASIYLTIAKRHGIATISHSHSTSSGRGIKSIVKSLMQYPLRFIPDYYLACSEEAGKWLFGKNVTKKKNFFIIKNGIEVEQYIFKNDLRERMRSELSLSNKLVIGHIGRFDYSKNHKFILHVFRELQKLRDDTVLLFIGDGELRSNIEMEVCKYHLADKVVFTGTVNNVADYLQVIDVFLFPSIYEGLGIAAIEAQASGIPCIISAHLPQEVCITDLITKVPLHKPLADWCQAIIEHSQYQRKDYSQQVIDSGYSITGIAEWLMNFYVRITSVN